MNGIEILIDLTSKNDKIPVIMVTGYGTEEIINQAIRMGARDYIVKNSFHLPELPNIVKKVIEENNINIENEDNHQFIIGENENQLNVKRDKLRELAEKSGIVFWIRELDTFKFIYMSQSIEDLFEISREVLCEKPEIWLEHIHPEDRNSIIETRSSIGLKPLNFIFRIITPLNKIKWIKAESQPVKFEKGNITYIVGTSQDISNFKDTELSLLKITNKLNFLISYSPAVIYTCNRDFFTTFISENVNNLLGYKAYEFIKNPFLLKEKIHPDEVNEVLTGISQKFENESKIFDSRFLHADGKYRWIHNEVKLIKYGTGDSFMLIGYLIDNTERKQTEEILKKSESYLSLVYNGTSDLMCLISVDGENSYRVVSCNKSYLETMRRFLGHLSENQIVGKKVDYIFENILKLKKTDSEFALNKYDEAIKTGRTINYEDVGESQFGFYSFEITISPIFDENGNCTHLLYVSRNITDRKLSEEKLRISETLFRNSFDHAAIGMAITSIEGKFLQVNNALSKMLGYTEPELLGESYPRLTHGEDITLSINNLKDLLSGKKQFAQFEKRYIHKSGSIVLTRLNTTLNRDKEGKPLYFITQIEDITEQKKSEEKLIEQAALLDITSDAIVVRDVDNKVLFWNKGAELLYKYKQEDVLGKNIFDLIYRQVSSDFEFAKQSVLSNGKWQGELKHFDKNGNVVIVDSKWTLMSDKKGKPISILVVNSDITKRKLVEAEHLRIQRLESIGTLASGIAHDLNNVLTPIMMSIEILKMRVNDKKGQDLIDALTKSSQHGAQLVKQVLTFARGIEGKHSTINLENILLEVKEIMSSSLPKNIDIITEIPEPLKPIQGDGTQLNQVIMNLLVNARDSMPQGGLIKISASNIYLDSIFTQMNPEAKPGNYVLLSISDTGSGIPKKIIDKIFEPFFTTKEVGKGTGLGLSTTLGIVRSHGGLINVKSEEGKGTEFKIYLPVSEFAEDFGPAETSIIKIYGNGETILLVEDDPSIVEAAVQTLEQYNYNVIKAFDGLEGLTLFINNKDKIDLVISDVTLPLMDGHQLVKAIFKINPEEKIIIMSGIEQTEAIREYGDRIKFIGKPFIANTLLIAIKEKLNS